MKLVCITDETHPIKYDLVRFEEPVVVNGKADLSGKQPLDKVRAVSRDAAVAMSVQEEWHEGKAVVVGGREFQAGDIEELRFADGVPNGFLRVNISPTEHIKLLPGEYTGTPPMITVPQKIIDEMDQSHMDTKVQSIVDGELTLWP